MTMTKRYYPGKSVTYRLNRDDQDIADFLNSLDQGDVAKVHRKAIRWIMTGQPAADLQQPAIPAISNETIQNALAPIVDDMNKKIDLILDMLQQGASAAHEHAATQDVEKEQPDQVDQEQLRAMADEIMNF